MKREYSKKEIREILQRDPEIPQGIEKRLQKTYEQIGIKEKVPMRYTRRYRKLGAVAAIVALVAGISIIGVAANYMLSADLKEKDEKLAYDIKVDQTMEAHEIAVAPTYLPEGYTLYGSPEDYKGEGGKWHNLEEGGGITIMQYNAAELDRMEKLGEGFRAAEKDELVEETSLNGMKVDIFVQEGFYVDGNSVKQLYIFNKEYGYAVVVWSDGNVSPEELKKVAHGLEIQVLEAVVPYTSDEVIKAEKAEREQWMASEQEIYQAGIPKENVHAVGEEVRDSYFEEGSSFDDVRYTVEDVQVKDTLLMEEYPRENYSNYDEEIAPWVNEDGSLRPHERYKEMRNAQGFPLPGQEPILETVNSKYVVLKMKAKNYSAVQSEWNAKDGVQIVPELGVYAAKGDGGLENLAYTLFNANEGYSLQWNYGAGTSSPIYFDKPFYTEGIQRLKHFNFRPIAAGEELDYTLVYAIDEDQIDNMCLKFYGWTNDPRMAQYVKIPRN